MLVGGGSVKLLDFGVATALGPDQARAATTAERALRGFAVHGTPEYMAPEQVAGEAVDRRTDLYALGCVLYEMLTGERAFDGPSTVVVMGKQLRETPKPPRTRTGRPIPRAVEAVVVRAMSKRPEDRFASAEAMAAAMARALREPARRREHVRRAATAVLSATAMLAAAAGASRFGRSAAGLLAGSSTARAVASPAGPPAPAPPSLASGALAAEPPPAADPNERPAAPPPAPPIVDRADRLATAQGKSRLSEPHHKPPPSARSRRLDGEGGACATNGTDCKLSATGASGGASTTGTAESFRSGKIAVTP
jgi:serine/threonine-protein kinase